MKVKGIESACRSVSGSEFLLPDSSASKARAVVQEPKYWRRITRSLLAFLLIAAFALGPVAWAGTDGQDVRERTLRKARKELRKGEFERAAKSYAALVAGDPTDMPAQLGAAFAYLKLQNFRLSFERSTEALKLDIGNARAHAIAGSALLHSGFVRAAVVELAEALRLDPKEALAHGAAAEIDYFEGRINDARAKSIYAHRLDPDEPDYVMTYARASSRAEDYKEAADAYELFLQIAPESDKERRERIQGLIRFYRQLAGIQVHQISGPQLSEVPFYLGTDRRPYIHIKINGRDAVFVVDTGSGFTVISKDAANRLGVSEIARGGKSQGIGGDGKFPIVYGLIRSLQMSDVKVRLVPCFIRPFHGLEGKPASERADGFIGLSVLSRFITQIDYQQGRLILDRDLDRPIPVVDTPGTTSIPFRMTQNGLISVETQWDGTNMVNAILDSGASSSAVSMAAVDRLKMRDRVIKGQYANVVGAAGIANNVEMLFLRDCRVADLGQSNIRALILDFDAINETSGFEQSGILGGDFLRHFTVTLDFPRTQVRLQPRPTPIPKD